MTNVQADDMLGKIYANQSACHVKKGNWKRAVEAADKARLVNTFLSFCLSFVQALSKNENNYKALFRKGKALAELGYTEKAEKALWDSLKKNPTCKASMYIIH